MGEWWWHMYTLMLDLMGAWTHTHIWCVLFTTFPGVLPLHTHTSSCRLEIWLMMTHTHAQAWLLAQTHFFTFTGGFPLHACGVTHNMRTYFTSVRWVFLVETVVLQTVLWDIRAWSASFLVIITMVILNIWWKFK